MLPSYTKNWNFSVNTQITMSYPSSTNSSESLTYANFWYQIKDYLKNNGWSVSYSCNGVNSPSTSADQWSSLSAISSTFGNSSGGAPWIVLRNDSISSNFNILISGGSTSSPGLYIAPQGFATTGASTTSVPATIIANDKITIESTVSFAGLVGQMGTFYIHCMNSTDNTSYRIMIYSQYTPIMEFFLEKVSSTSLTSGQWTVPFLWRYISKNQNITYGPWKTRYVAGGPVDNLQMITESLSKETAAGYKQGFDDSANQNIIFTYEIGTFASSIWTDHLCPSPADTFAIPNIYRIGTLLSDNVSTNKFVVVGGTNNNSHALVIPWNGSSYLGAY